MPRVMFNTPEAIPACCSGAAPMIDALLGEVNNPIPTPTTASRARKPAVPGRNAPRSASAAATRAIPLTVSGRAPARSASRPANGATIPNASGMAMSSSPDRAVPTPRPRSR